ncbi:MAG: tyrosine-type recombinase/integrase [Acidobacteria bacterium]|nr:tyrosine-type recombinase/integrase [Acidobacteriota bacterium]
MNLQRARYQQGYLTTERRSKGSPVWIYRWREKDHRGHFSRRKQIVGSKSDLPTKADALKAVEGLRLEINVETGCGSLGSMKVNELIEHFRRTELADSNKKSTRTKQVYAHQLVDIISPKWGEQRLKDIKPIAVEDWLNRQPGAPGSRAKTKGVMGVLFQHAMRYEWMARNPIRLVRQSSLPQQEQIVLEPFELAALLKELHDPFASLILLAAVTGLRRGELFGLKWEDIDFAEAEMHVVRSLVDQVEGPPKTLASRRPLPLSKELATALKGWRQKAEYSKPTDWIFASPLALGKKPYWPDAVLKRHVRPAAARAGITKTIGWHSFRRTLAPCSTLPVHR